MGTIVITGGAGGIGAALVLAVQQAGHRAVSFDLHPNPAADQSVILDLTDEPALGIAFAEVGDLAGLACLAQTRPILQRIEDMDWAAWARVMAVNVGSTMLALKHAQMQDGAGIVLIGAAPLPAQTVGSVAYHTSKGAVLGLMRAASGGFAARGIRVNAVRPDCANQPATDPSKIAQAVLFLLSPAASFITGTELIVDGGNLRNP